MLLLLKITAGLAIGGTAALLMGLLGSGLTGAASVGGIFGLYTAARL